MRPLRIVEVFILMCSSWGVQVKAPELGYFVDFLVSIRRWSKLPHHIRVNPLGGEQVGRRW
jgi:hypothetical protein